MKGDSTQTEIVKEFAGKPVVDLAGNLVLRQVNLLINCKKHCSCALDSLKEIYEGPLMEARRQWMLDEHYDADLAILFE